MKLEDIKELLIPTFRFVIQNNYDPDTLLAYMNPEDMPDGGKYNDCITHLRDMLGLFLPEATIVDAGNIYKTTNRNEVHGWWIQFKL